jgi:hypothetical protein
MSKSKTDPVWEKAKKAWREADFPNIKEGELEVKKADFLDDNGQFKRGQPSDAKKALMQVIKNWHKKQGGTSHSQQSQQHDEESEDQVEDLTKEESEMVSFHGDLAGAGKDMIEVKASKKDVKQVIFLDLAWLLFILDSLIHSILSLS